MEHNYLNKKKTETNINSNPNMIKTNKNPYFKNYEEDTNSSDSDNDTKQFNKKVLNNIETQLKTTKNQSNTVTNNTNPQKQKYQESQSESDNSKSPKTPNPKITEKAKTSTKTQKRNEELLLQTTNPHTSKPYSKKYFEILRKRMTLPAWEAKDELFQMVQENQVIVLKGETGSGKTTQMPQFLLEHYKSIAVTQPRRVAAMSVAKRVSEEMDVTLGEEVGYSIRFEDCCGNKTKLKYMTDGMLLKEAMTDRMLSKYSLIVLDECHERTLATEILFGHLKEILPMRKELKLIVMSATIDINKFTDFFDAPLLSVPGRLHHVEVDYLKESCADYLEEAVSYAVHIHETVKEPGDILIFLTGEDEIENCCAKLQESIDEEEYGYVSVIPLYSTLPPHQQQRIFDNPPKTNNKGRCGRKIIVSTNIAETSITIDGIVYVIDSGFSKQKVYNPRLRMESLLVTPISKASAKQRAGRAGRTREGKCIRLYTKDAYDELEKTCYPEILRSNLSNVVLTLLRLGVKDIVHFDFMDPPAPETMMRAIELLHYMGAISEEGQLTDEGRAMALTPLDPELAKVLLVSKKYKCVNEVLTIVSMLSVPGVFLRPRHMQTSADDAKKKFIHNSGDHISLLLAYNSFKINKENENYCKNNFLNFKNLRNADNVRNQLAKNLITEGIVPPANDYPIEFTEKKVEKILKALLSGCFAQVCNLELAGYYLTVRENQMVLMHPSTSLTYKPSWVMYHDFVCTGKNYIRTLSRIKPEWLFKIAPYYYNIDEFPEGRVKRELRKVLVKMSEENDEEVDKEEAEEKRDLKLKEINEEILKDNSAYSKYSALKKYKVTK